MDSVVTETCVGNGWSEFNSGQATHNTLPGILLVPRLGNAVFGKQPSQMWPGYGGRFYFYDPPIMLRAGSARCCLTAWQHAGGVQPRQTSASQSSDGQAMYRPANTWGTYNLHLVVKRVPAVYHC